MVTVGCDPEFLVKNSAGSIIRCGDVYKDLPAGNIGTDHGGSCCELRPKHGTPAEVTANIRALFEYFKSAYPNHKIVAGGGGEEGYQSIGGHIHIGGISLNGHYRSVTRQAYHGSRNVNYINADAKLVLALDFFIGKRLKKVGGGNRPSSASYGRPGDIETKSHGFEYRTPPSWVTDPYLTESTLAIAKQIAEMWQTKQTAFDEIFIARKSVARRRDYDILIPAEGPNKVYMQTQVQRFRRVAFSKSYKMNNPECLDLWFNQTKLNNFYQTETVRRRRQAANLVDNTPVWDPTITLQVCQIKKIEQDRDFGTETVMKVCRFATPEVRIYPMGEYTPWQFQLLHDIRLRPDTIYFSKELRQYLKIKRGGAFRNRFIDIQQRRVEGRVQQLENAIFFNSRNSNPEITNRIIEIIETCLRSKKRKPTGTENEGDD
jgi:Phage phiEco32-like COOH.NH2 ligase-type 2